ncbi:MAG: hypothetical protein FPO08_06735 [Geobacter sp.]|nr:MAG: hypothetical protein FPO08_06735 [Geobacter sp.]
MNQGVEQHQSGSYRTSFDVYGEKRPVRIVRQRVEGLDAPRLVVVSYLPNEMARDMFELCIRSIQRHTPEPHELWVVDNCSPPHLRAWLENEPGLNLVLSETEPVPRVGFWQRLAGKRPEYSGSYANAVALELAARAVDPGTRLMMTLHMDTVACCSGWLSYLSGRMDGETRCVGVRMDTTRVRTIHVLGMLFDFTLFEPMQFTFRHGMPAYDTGDFIPMTLERSGYRIWGCPNTLWNPELVDRLEPDSPYRGIRADRSLDDNNRVIFMHMGRGVATSKGQTDSMARAEEWLKFGREVVLTT